MDTILFGIFYVLAGCAFHFLTPGEGGGRWSMAAVIGHSIHVLAWPPLMVAHYSGYDVEVGVGKAEE